LSGRGSPPLTSVTHTRDRYTFASRSTVVTTNATCLPSGDTRGLPGTRSAPMSVGCMPPGVVDITARLGRAVGRLAAVGLLARVGKDGLGGGQAGDRHPERRAA